MVKRTRKAVEDAVKAPEFGKAKKDFSKARKESGQDRIVKELIADVLNNRRLIFDSDSNTSDAQEGIEKAHSMYVTPPSLSELLIIDARTKASVEAINPASGSVRKEIAKTPKDSGPGVSADDLFDHALNLQRAGESDRNLDEEGRIEGSMKRDAQTMSLSEAFNILMSKGPEKKDK